MDILDFRAWYLITVCVALSFPSRCEGKKWALLVAGSPKGWWSYPYQSDVCHAYQVFSDHGVPDEQIVVMMYDDIAYNELNPYPGVIINHPDGPNVYPGVPHDYVGDDVSAEVFLAVLQGDRDRVYELTGYHGKVIDSGPEDHVFVYFASSGYTGFLTMPNDPPVYASELNDALKSMHDAQKFAKLVFYLKANMAGGMFEDLLPDDINVYAVADCMPDEGSILHYWIEEFDWVAASVFGSIWLENCDEVDIRYETLQEQFELIYEKVSTREEKLTMTPTQYGDLSFTSLALSEFVGDGKALPRMKDPALREDNLEIFSLKRLLEDPRQESRLDEIRADVEEKHWLQTQTDVFFSSVVNAAVPNGDVDWVLNTRPTIKQRSAYEYAVGHLLNVCPRLRPSVNPFVGPKMSALVNLTNRRPLRKIMAAVDVVASTSPLCQ